MCHGPSSRTICKPLYSGLSDQAFSVSSPSMRSWKNERPRPTRRFRMPTKAKEEAQAMKAEYEEEHAGMRRTRPVRSLLPPRKRLRIQSEEMLREALQTGRCPEDKSRELTSFRRRRKAVNELKDEIGGMAMEIAGKGHRTGRLTKRITRNSSTNFISQVDDTADRNAGDIHDTGTPESMEAVMYDLAARRRAYRTRSWRQMKVIRDSFPGKSRLCAASLQSPPFREDGADRAHRGRFRQIRQSDIWSIL